MNECPEQDYMNNELRFDWKAAHIGLQQAQEVSDIAHTQRLVGIQHDIVSAQNESLHPDDAYWNGEYQIGVDGRGNVALVTSELGMIPGRIHREDSQAMSLSMIRNVAYTFDQIQEGTLPHSSWRAAIEQVREFRAFEQKALTLNEGESMLGFAMNGETTHDGIAFFLMTRKGNTFQFETRLIGGVSEAVAHDLLESFTSQNAKRISLKEGTDSPLYSAVRGTISINLKNTDGITTIIQDILKKHHETLTEIVSLGSCRTKAVKQDEKQRKTIIIQSDQIRNKQKYDQLVEPAIPQSGVHDIKEEQDWGEQKVIWDNSVRPWVIHGEVPIQKQVKQQAVDVIEVLETESVRLLDEPEKNFETAPYEVRTKPTQIVREMILPNDQQENVSQDIPMIIFQASPKPTRVLEPIRKQEQTQETKHAEVHHETKKPDMTVPIATFIVATDSKIDAQALRQYKEKFIAISLAAHTHIPVKQIIGEHIPVADHVSVEMEFQKENEHNVVYEVDELVIIDMQRIVDSIGKSIQKEESVKTVMKLLWMMPSQNEGECVPVEEVEIAQDSTRTLQNLLHFLRKVVHKYVGNDTIRERIVQRIASDKWDDGIGTPEQNMVEEITEYLSILKAGRMYNRLFAVVN